MIEITKEMVYKLNERLADNGYAPRFKHEVIDLDASSTSPVSHPPQLFHQLVAILPNSKGLKDYSIYIDDDLYEQVVCWFLINYNIVLSHNNTRTALWPLKFATEASRNEDIK